MVTGDRRFGMGKSYRVIYSQVRIDIFTTINESLTRSIRETIRGSRAGQIELYRWLAASQLNCNRHNRSSHYSMVPPLATLRKISSSSISIMLSGSKSYVNKLWRRWVL